MGKLEDAEARFNATFGNPAQRLAKAEETFSAVFNVPYPKTTHELKRKQASGRQAYEPPVEGRKQTTEQFTKAAGAITTVVAGAALTPLLETMFAPLATTRMGAAGAGALSGAGAGVGGALAGNAVSNEQPTLSNLAWNAGGGAVVGAPIGYLRGGLKATQDILPLTTVGLRNMEEVTKWLPEQEVTALNKTLAITKTATTRGVRAALRKKVGAREGEFTLQAAKRYLADDKPVTWQNFVRRAIVKGTKNPIYTEQETEALWKNLPAAYEGLARLDTGTMLGRNAREAIRLFMTKATRSVSESLRRDTAFGSVGPHLAKSVEHMNAIQDHIRASGFDLVDNIMRGFSASEREIVGRVLANELALHPNLKNYAKLQGAVDDMRELYGSFAKQAASLGIKTYDPFMRQVRPFMAQDFYFPAYYKSNAVQAFLKQDSPALTEALNKVRRIFKYKGPRWREQAFAKLKTILLSGEDTQLSASIRDRNLNYARILDLPVGREWDARVVGKRYILGASNRLAAARLFGPSDELFHEMRRQVAREGGDVDRLTTIYNNVNGRRYDNYDGALRLLRNYIAYTSFKFGTGVLQLSQIIPTASIHGLRNTAKATYAYLGNGEVREAVKRAAAMLPASSMSETELSGKAMRALMRVTMIEPIDKGVRGIGAIAGLMNASGLAEKYGRALAGGAMDAAARLAVRLKAYGIDPADLADTGVLSEGQAAQAIYYGANRASFASRASDLPEMAHSNKFFYFLRRFGVQSSDMFKSEIIRPAQLWATSAGKAGDIRPLLRMAVVAPATAPFIRYGQDIVNGKQPKAEDVATVKLLTGKDVLPSAAEAFGMAASIGLTGVWGDFLREQALSSPAELVANTAGAGIGIPAEAAYTMALYGRSALTGKERTLKAANKRLARKVPVVGNIIANTQK